MDVERLGRPVPVRIPHVVHDLLSRTDRTRILCEERKEIELLGRQQDFGVIDRDSSGSSIDHEATDSLFAVGGFRDGCGASGNGPDTRNELAEPEGFDEVVVRAEFEEHDPIDLLTACRHDDDRDIGSLPQGTTYVFPIHVGKAEIEQHEIRGVGFECGATAVNPRRLEPFPVESVEQWFCDGIVVFDNEELHRTPRGVLGIFAESLPSASLTLYRVSIRCAKTHWFIRYHKENSVKLNKPLGTTLGAVGLTIISAGAALAVNVGILGHQTDSTVGTLETATTLVTDAPALPNVRYVTVYADGPSVGGGAEVPATGTQVTATAVPAPSVGQATSTSGPDDDSYEGAYEGADDDD